MGSFSAVMFFLYEMVPGPEGYQVGVVSRGRDRNRSGTSNVGVAQLEGELLELISFKVVVVPENVVVARSRCTLDTCIEKSEFIIRTELSKENMRLFTLVRTKVEIKFGWVADPDIHGGTGRNVSRPTRLFLLIRAEEASMMPLLHNNKCDSWLVIRLKFDASFTNGCQLVLQHLRKLAFRDAVSVHDYSMGFVASSRLVKHHQMVLYHDCQVLDDFSTMSLHSDSCRIPKQTSKMLK